MKRTLAFGACILAAIVAALVLSSLALRRATAPTSPREEGGAIFFVREDIALLGSECICRYDLATGKLRVVTEGMLAHAQLSPFRFSLCPNGTKVAYVMDRGGGDRVCVVDSVSRVTQDVTRGIVAQEPPLVSTVVWSPDGRCIAFSHCDWQFERVFVVRPDGTDLHEVGKWSLTPPEDKRAAFAEATVPHVFVVALQWQRSGSRELLLGLDYWGETRFYRAELDQRDLSVRSLQPAAEPKEKGPRRDWSDRRVWSPDGKRLAYASMDNQLFTASTKGARMGTRVFKGEEGTEIRSIVWSPTGSYLVFELGRRPSLLSWHMGFPGRALPQSLLVVSAQGGQALRISGEGLFVDRDPIWIACPLLPDAP